MPNRYQPNAKGFTALATGPEMAAHMRLVGNHWANDLRAQAPVESGEYKSSIDVSVVNSLIRHLPRVATRITANTPYAATLEWGNRHMRTPPQPLTKLVDRIQAADPRRRRGRPR